MVEARDTTTPVANTATAEASATFNIAPALTPPTLSGVTAVSNDFTAQFTADSPRWPDPGAGCLQTTCHWQFSWAFGDGSTLVSTSATVRHAYARSGYFTATVRVTVVGYPDGEPQAAGASVKVPIVSDARTLFFVSPAASDNRLFVTLRSRVSASLVVRLVGAGLHNPARTVSVRAGAHGTLGRGVRVVFSVRGATSPVAELSVGYAGQLAGGAPKPLPLLQVVWLR